MAYADFYQPGVPAQIEPPTKSLVHLLEGAVSEGKNAVATEFFGKTMTYTELGEAINRAAEGLRQLGVNPGDRVAIILPNCPQHVIAFYAILRLGAIVVEHNPLYTARELRHMFEDHSARVAIAWDIAVTKLRQQPDDIELDHIIAVNLTDALPTTLRLALHLPLPPLRKLKKRLTAKASDIITWKALLAHRPLRHNHPRPRVTDVATIQYTSGTSGVPKGAMLTHFNLYSNAIQGDLWMRDAKTGEETFYAILPFFHALGMTVCLTYAIMKQARLCIFPTFDLSLIMGTAKKRPPTVLCAVPPIFEAMGAAAKKQHISLKAARICLSGAMALSEPVREVWNHTGAGPLVEGYGLTEASPIALGNPFHSTRKPGTVGLPFPSTSIMVVDLDDRTQQIRCGERGELLISGPQVFQGYWNNPDETEKTLLPGRWLATGDIVVQDEDGFVTVVDRKKELIITGGFNVAPHEVESVLRTHPDITDAAVVGLPHPHSGEEVVAVVTVEPKTKIDEAEVRAFCRARLAAYKVPRKVVTVDSLPKTMLGKTRRVEVRQDLLTRKPH